jgi:Peptidase C39 family
VHAVHDVPMCRQRIEPEEWQAHGGQVLGDRADWSDRACGMAALRMILLAYLGDAPPLTELVRQGVAYGALTDRGWLHAGIAQMATDYGIPATAEAVPARDLPGRIADAPVIVSVADQLPEDGRKGGHLIVAHGCDGGSQDPDIFIRDPSSWGQDHDRVPLRRLTASYTGRAITFAPVSELAGGWS